MVELKSPLFYIISLCVVWTIITATLPTLSNFGSRTSNDAQSISTDRTSKLGRHLVATDDYHDDSIDDQYGSEVDDDDHSSGSSGSHAQTSETGHSLFGAIDGMEAFKGTISIIIIIFAVQAVEYVFHRLKHLTEDTPFAEMVAAIEGELMVVGFTAFIFKVLVNTTDFLTHEWFFALEYADVFVPLFSFSYCLVGGLLIAMSISQCNKWSIAHHYKTVELLEEYFDTLLKRRGYFLRWLLTLPTAIDPVYSKLEFRIFQYIFCDMFKIQRAAFAFDQYVEHIVEKYLMSIIKIRPIDWFCLIALLLLNWGRNRLEMNWYHNCASGHHGLSCRQNNSNHLITVCGLCIFFVTCLLAYVSRRLERTIMQQYGVISDEVYHSYLQYAELEESSAVEKHRLNLEELKVAAIEAKSKHRSRDMESFFRIKIRELFSSVHRNGQENRNQKGAYLMKRTSDEISCKREAKNSINSSKEREKQMTGLGSYLSSKVPRKLPKFFAKKYKNSNAVAATTTSASGAALSHGTAASASASCYSQDYVSSDEHEKDEEKEEDEGVDEDGDSSSSAAESIASNENFSFNTEVDSTGAIIGSSSGGINTSSSRLYRVSSSAKMHIDMRRKIAARQRQIMEEKMFGVDEEEGEEEDCEDEHVDSDAETDNGNEGSAYGFSRKPTTITASVSADNDNKEDKKRVERMARTLFAKENPLISAVFTRRVPVSSTGTVISATTAREKGGREERERLVTGTSSIRKKRISVTFSSPDDIQSNITTSPQQIEGNQSFYNTLSAGSSALAGNGLICSEEGIDNSAHTVYSVHTDHIVEQLLTEMWDGGTEGGGGGGGSRIVFNDFDDYEARGSGSKRLSTKASAATHCTTSSGGSLAGAAGCTTTGTIKKKRRSSIEFIKSTFFPQNSSSSSSSNTSSDLAVFGRTDSSNLPIDTTPLDESSAFINSSDGNEEEERGLVDHVVAAAAADLERDENEKVDREDAIDQAILQASSLCSVKASRYAKAGLEKPASVRAYNYSSRNKQMFSNNNNNGNNNNGNNSDSWVNAVGSSYHDGSTRSDVSAVGETGGPLRHEGPSLPYSGPGGYYNKEYRNGPRHTINIVVQRRTGTSTKAAEAVAVVATTSSFSAASPLERENSGISQVQSRRRPYERSSSKKLRNKQRGREKTMRKARFGKKHPSWILRRSPFLDPHLDKVPEVRNLKPKHRHHGHKHQHASAGSDKGLFAMHNFSNKIDHIFWFSSPNVYFESVQLLIMILAAYLGLWSSNFVSASGLWKLYTLLPVVGSIAVYIYVVKSAALLKALESFDAEVMLDVLEQTEASQHLGELMRNKILSRLQEMGEPQIELYALFREIDQHGSGKLTRPQFAGFMNAMDISFSRKNWKQIYREIDRNYDDMISFEEFFLFLFPNHGIALALEKKRLDLVRERVDAKDEELAVINKRNGLVGIRFAVQESLQHTKADKAAESSAARTDGSVGGMFTGNNMNIRMKRRTRLDNNASAAAARGGAAGSGVSFKRNSSISMNRIGGGGAVGGAAAAASGGSGGGVSSVSSRRGSVSVLGDKRKFSFRNIFSTKNSNSATVVPK